jgi:SAM-dependent methyltransferase
MLRDTGGRILSTDRDWEKWGSSDPYFGVLSTNRFRQKHLSEETREEFFETGEEHVRMILETLRRVFDPEFTPGKILDFGCGVGRLLIPFARRQSYVVGVRAKAIVRSRRGCISVNATGSSSQLRPVQSSGFRAGAIG